MIYLNSNTKFDVKRNEICIKDLNKFTLKETFDEQLFIFHKEGDIESVLQTTRLKDVITFAAKYDYTEVVQDITLRLGVPKVKVLTQPFLWYDTGLVLVFSPRKINSSEEGATLETVTLYSRNISTPFNIEKTDISTLEKKCLKYQKHIVEDLEKGLKAINDLITIYKLKVRKV